MSEWEVRHHLIQKEFRTVLEEQAYQINYNTSGVVVLSADSIEYVNDEDRIRLDFGIEIIKNIVGKKLGKNTDNVTPQDMEKVGPLLILNAEVEQLPLMQTYLNEKLFPDSKIHSITCGLRGEANTKTQILALNDDSKLQDCKHVIVITSSYHIPRVRRTTAACLGANINYDVVSVPINRYPYNVFRKVRGEVRRIMDYSDSGDIKRVS